ncbi:MAG: aminopeptidase [Candidatus Aenigmatarchaeota archaeon]
MKLENIFKRALDIKKNDKVLIITDKKKLKIAKKFLRSLKKIFPNTSLVSKSVGKYDGEEPSKIISNLMLKYDVIIAVTNFSLTHTNARRRASENGIRIVSMPGFTKKMMKALQADPFEMLRVGKRIESLLKKTDIVRVMTESGTYISFSVKNRFIEIDSGIFEKESCGNMPSGEISLSPVEGTANGVIVINSMFDYAKNKTVVHVKNGKAFDISDKKCKLAKIFSTVKNSTNIAELGIGLNKKAKIIGRILQDEKVFKTCHIAFGNNKSYKGKVYSNVHLDAVLFKPTIWFDEKMIMMRGKLLI